MHGRGTSLRRLSATSSPAALLTLRLLFVDRRLSNALHRGLGLLLGRHAHPDQQSEPSGFVVVKSILGWSSHVIILLAAWPLKSFQHRSHVVQDIDVYVVA
jgi:hypothetical protein